MFELGKKDGDAGQTPAAQRSQGSAAAAPSTSRGTGSGQFAVIGRSIQIKGDVIGDEDLVIEGNVSGTVELRNHALTIGREGKVNADVYARSVSVEGTIDGDLYASERISIRSSARVRGNLLSPSIALEDGASFKGSVEMDKQAVDKAIGTSGPSKPAARPEPAGKAGVDSKPVTGQASAAGAST